MARWMDKIERKRERERRIDGWIERLIDRELKTRKIDAAICGDSVKSS